MASDSTPRYAFPFPRLTGQEPSVPVDNEGLAVAVEASLSLTDDAAVVDRARITQNEADIAALETIGGDFPAGVINMYGGQTPPGGWLFCDGSSKSTATYADLFAAIGYGFGGSGSSFNVPDMRDRVAVGVDAGGVGQPGAQGGAPWAAITENQLPIHSHPNAHTHSGSTSWSDQHDHNDGGIVSVTLQTTGTGGVGNDWQILNPSIPHLTNPGGSHVHTFVTHQPSPTSTGNTGGNGPFPIIQPYTVVNYIIRH